MPRIAIIGTDTMVHDHVTEGDFDENSYVGLVDKIELISINIDVILTFEPEIIILLNPQFISLQLLSRIKVLDCNFIGYISKPKKPAYQLRKNHFQSLSAYSWIEKWATNSHALHSLLKNKINIVSVMPLPVNDALFISPDSLPEKFEKITFCIEQQSLNRVNGALFLTEQIKKNQTKYLQNNEGPFSIGSIYINMSDNCDIDPGGSVINHMARGFLVMSSVIYPEYGLLPETEFFRINNKKEILSRIIYILENQELAAWIQRRGSLMSQRYRASILWDRLVSI